MFYGSVRRLDSPFNCQIFIDTGTSIEHQSELLVKSNNPIFDPLPARRLEGRPTARSGRTLSGHEVVERQARPRVRHYRACTIANPQHNRQECSGCEMTNHDARNCPNPGMTSNASSVVVSAPLAIPALAPLATQAPVPPALPIQAPGQYHGQHWASTAPPGYYGPWNIPGGQYYGPNTQFPTQNQVSGPPPAFPGMYQVPYFPTPTQSSQEGYIQVPRTQYPAPQGGNHNSQYPWSQ
jgi:hypothetical protein